MYFELGYFELGWSLSLVAAGGLLRGIPPLKPMTGVSQGYAEIAPYAQAMGLTRYDQTIYLIYIRAN